MLQLQGKRSAFLHLVALHLGFAVEAVPIWQVGLTACDSARSCYRLSIIGETKETRCYGRTDVRSIPVPLVLLSDAALELQRGLPT